MKKKKSTAREFDAELIRSYMLGGTVVKDAENYSSEKCAKIDLHFDDSGKTYSNISEGEKLLKQLDHLDKYFDRSLSSGCKKVEINHGKGKGKLKDAVHEFLKKHPRVKHFSLAGNNSGVSIVVFK